MQVYIGIDWSEAKHDVVFMNAAGSPIAQIATEHSPEGFLKLEATRESLGLEPKDCAVGLETVHNLIIDYLWAHNYHEVYVITPKMVKANRSRFRHSSARSDTSDALLLAELLRTDRGRLQPWRPDSLLTRQLRAKVSLINFITRDIVRLTNRLRAVLLRYYPAAIGLFSDIANQISLQFIQAYPRPEIARVMTFQEFVAFAREHRYPCPINLPRRFAHLQLPYPEANADTVDVFQGEAVLLAASLLTQVKTKIAAIKELQTLFKQHPDFEVFVSLPGAGNLLAPALLTKFGDDRQRFPSPASVQALAGTCPVTKSSGKYKVVKFRRSCDREFRYFVQQWARASLKTSVWANAYWQQVRPHCRSTSHAYRCLANRWLAVAWKLWQTGQPYDEGYHLRNRAFRSRLHK